VAQKHVHFAYISSPTEATECCHMRLGEFGLLVGFYSSKAICCEVLWML